MKKMMSCRIGVCALTIALALTARSNAAITLKSLDETIQISLPDGWREVNIPPGISESLEIVAINERLNSEVLVTVEEAEDKVISIDDYMGGVLNHLKNKYPDITHTDPKSTKVNSKEAMRCEYKATQDGTKVGCVLTVLKVGTHFEMVVGTTPIENFNRLKGALAGYADKVSDVTAPKGSDVVVKGKDGNIQLTLPQNWKQEPLPPNSGPYLQLYAQNFKLNCGVMVASQSREDIAQTLLENLDATLDNFTKEYPGFTHTVPEPMKLGGHDALRCEAQMEAGGEKLCYIFTAVQTDTSYNQIYAFSADEKFARLKPALIKLSSSLQELKVAPADDTPAVAGKGLPFKTKDATLKITLTRDWKPMETRAGSEVQLALNNVKQDTQLMLISESRDKVKFDLKEYTVKVIESLEKSEEFTGASHTEPEAIQIAGHDALRFDFHAVAGGTKVGYMITVVQTDKNFTRLQFSSTASKFTKFKPTWIKMADTLKDSKADDDADQ